VPTNQRTLTKAVFGNLDFKFNDWLSAHAGARHTWSSINFRGCMQDVDGLWAPGANSILARINPSAPSVGQGSCVTVLPDLTMGQFYKASLDEENTSWRVGLDAKPMRGTLIYASISRGYKSGSYPNINATTYASYQPVKQEAVTAYELGIKTNLGTRIAHLDVSVFYYDYANKQFRGRIVDPLGVFGAVEALVNVPNSRVLGAETSLRIEPRPFLSLNAGVTYLDTKVTSSFQNYDPYGSPANYNGEAFPFTPRWSMQGGLELHKPLDGRNEGFLGLDASYRSSTTSAFGTTIVDPRYSNSLFRIDGYALVDGQAGIRSQTGHWQLSVWVHNMFNKYYWTDAFRQIDNVSRHVGEPRTFGLRMNYDF
jgi:iron complex outermembrane receptor protein